MQKHLKRMLKRLFKGRIGNDLTDDNAWLNSVCRVIESSPSTQYVPAPWGKLRVIEGSSVPPQIRDIFIDENYGFAFPKPPSRIVDCGGNVGLSAIWFAKTYPSAIVEVYEAEFRLVEVIKENVANAGVADRVKVHAFAVSHQAGHVSFSSVGDDKGKICELGEKVPCVDISDVVGRSLDLLKMDIEGAEFECFERLAATDKMCVPRAIVAELHIDDHNPSKLITLLSALASNAFNVSLHGDLALWCGPSKEISPFASVGNKRMFLHVHAWRETYSEP